MTNKKLPVHVLFTIAYFVGAVITLIPWWAASETCRLGYKALCSFTPISTLVLVALGVLHIYLHSRSTAAKAK